MEIVSDINLIDRNILGQYAAVDIGNSRLKVLYFNVVESFPYTYDFDEMLKKFLNNLSNKKVTFIISCVNQIRLNAFLQILTNYEDYNYIFAQNLLEKQKLVDFSQISGTGEDRKMGIIGGLLYGNAPFITIDVGTALTINVLDKNRILQGGVILPGPITQINSLNQSAEGLKEFSIEQPTSIIGRNSADAINSGMQDFNTHDIMIFIDYIQKVILNINDCPIYITGGASVLLFNTLQKSNTSIFYKPHIVLLGLLNLLQRK
jgi:pantothenate kinase type III